MVLRQPAHGFEVLLSSMELHSMGLAQVQPAQLSHCAL